MSEPLRALHAANTARMCSGFAGSWEELVALGVGTQICFARCQSLCLVGFWECPGLAEMSCLVGPAACRRDTQDGVG